MRWIPAELHTHTQHSDGQFTVESLCRSARDRGYELIALTDHNTLSGLDELTPELAAQTIPVIRGIEWTAYYGHMLALDCKRYVDWRESSRTELDEKIRQVRENDGLVGIAHPFAIGSPLCTGCYWEYEVSDWSNVNYIEVWSGPFPSIHAGRNGRAMEMWQGLLDRGYHIAASYGKDWHMDFEEKEPWGCTYLAVKEVSAGGGLDALRAGRTMVSMGPRPVAEIALDGKALWPGDAIPAGSELDMILGLDEHCWRGAWERFGFVPRTAQIIGERGRVLAQVPLEGWSTAHVRLRVRDSHFHVLYTGNVKDRQCPIAFTSPYYTYA